MVLTMPFSCATEVRSVDDVALVVAVLIGSRSWALVTSSYWRSSGVVERLRQSCGAPIAVISDVAPNPELSHMFSLAEQMPSVDVVVALGGGSVIDAAKAMAALVAIKHDRETMVDHLRNGVPLPADMKPMPIIAIPTTSGTGAELTPWGTIWGDDGIKFSVNHPALRPRQALLDASLCITMPHDLTLASGLDALSHAMESVWNRRHSQVTDGVATQAIRMIHESLPLALADSGNVQVRRNVQTASVLAGMCMGTTQTALAHSISYPFTSRFGIPHGLACSFTLPEIARFNLEADPNRLKPIADALDCDPADLGTKLEAWLDELEIGEFLGRYVGPDAIASLPNGLINRSRAMNNIREVDGPMARAIAGTALKRLIKAPITGAVAAQ
jgi:phosphonate metabolism-associated iron-containing alcohol dehydrogenase